MQEGPRILEGIKVLDVATFIFGPAAATVMSDFGADVIKIEHPKIGDPYRYLTQMAPMPACEPQLLLALDRTQQAQRRARPDQARGAGRAAQARDRRRRSRHQLSPVGARQARAALRGPAAAQRSPDLRAGLGLRRDRGRGGEAGLRRVGVVGTLGSDGRGARAGRRARLVDAGHGRSPERDGAPVRDHDGALPPRAHRQGRQGVELADGERRVVEQLPDPGRAVRLGVPAADAPRGIAERAGQPLSHRRWPLHLPPAAAGRARLAALRDDASAGRSCCRILDSRPRRAARRTLRFSTARSPTSCSNVRSRSGATSSTATTSPSARCRSRPKRRTTRR